MRKAILILGIVLFTTFFISCSITDLTEDVILEELSTDGEEEEINDNPNKN